MPLTAKEKEKLDKDLEWIKVHDHFFVCPICFAMITDKYMKEHTKWHKKLDS